MGFRGISLQAKVTKSSEKNCKRRQKYSAEQQSFWNPVDFNWADMVYLVGIVDGSSARPLWLKYYKEKKHEEKDSCIYIGNSNARFLRLRYRSLGC